MKKICFLNNGCGAHLEVFRRIYKSVENSYTLTNIPSMADVIIQYFCAITQNDAVETLFEELKYLSLVKRKDATLIVCGCAVDAIGMDFFYGLDFVDYAIGGNNFLSDVLDIMDFRCSKEYYLGDNPYTFSIDIVSGCYKQNGWCSFCKQHYLKRATKSIPMEEILQIATEVTSNTHVHTIALSGFNICNYGIDIGDKKPKLHLLVKALSKIPSVKFIELYSLTVSCMYEELTQEIASNSKVTLVELPIQSGSNSMLQIMNTGSNVEQIQYLLDRLSHKPMRGMIVVSHPGETREYLYETIDFIKKNNIWYTLVSGYQNSEGTPSYSMEQLNEDEFRYHHDIVSSTVNDLRKKFLDSLLYTKVTGYLIDSKYYEDSDTAFFLISAKDFVGYIDVEVCNFSSSELKVLIDKADKYLLVRATIVEVSDYEKVCLVAEDLEVLS